MTMTRARSGAIRLLAAALLALGAPAQAQKPTLAPPEYGRWETLSTTLLSPDGRWLAWTVNRVDGTTMLSWRAVAGGDAVTVAHAMSPVFSADSRWLAYSVAPPASAADAGTASARNHTALVDLTTGTVTDLGEYASAQFSPDASHVVLRGYIGGQAGADLSVRSLRSRGEQRLKNVTSHRWRGTGSVLAFVAQDSAGRSSVSVLDAASATLRILAHDSASFTGLAWRPNADDLAVLRVQADPRFADPTHTIMLWRGATRAPRPLLMDPAAAVSFPQGYRVTDVRDLSFNADGSTIFFGVRENRPRIEPGPPPESLPTVEIWHSRDVEIVPEQKMRANLDAMRSHVAAWRPSAGRVVRIGGPEYENVQLSDGRFAVALDARPYERQRMFGPTLRDMYVVDVTTGTRTLAAQGVQYQYGIAPGGRFLLFVRDGHFWTYDTRTGSRVNVTRDIATSFINSGHDFALRDKPPFGVAGWTPDDRAVLLHDRYDVWEVRADGSGGTRLTDGARERIRHRRLWLNPDERVVDLAQPVFVGLYGETTKQTGFARIRRGQPAERLVLTDAQLSRLAKADAAPVYMYRAERFDDSPDVFVGSERLADARQVTRTNAFADEYAWGRAQLIDFTSATGEQLQGALFYPAVYDPARRYPMIVDIYETVSNTLHNFTVPSEHSMHNTTVFTQNGYFVFKPDIAYRIRDPGVSAVEAIVPAVRAALRLAAIDSARMALLGHSWGGYQTAFTITQTDMFRAAVAAAPIANMVSMYLSIFWNTGGTDARMFEIDQGRMEVPFWDDRDAYIRNSPVFHMQRSTTPIMIAFGDQDGAVDWHQGIELYNAARRAGKDAVLLVYEGENHSLARKPNQLDYHRRTNEWLAHWLRDAPAPEWIATGIRHADRQRELERTGSTQNRN